MMDSGNNSGSLQSSSGNEEECNSRATLHLPHQPPPPPLINHQLNQTNNLNNINNNNNNNPLFFSSSQQNQLLDLDSVVWSNTLPSFSDHHHHHLSTTSTTNPIPPVKNPKKRSRASRRAPTTVLTTDTNNFRSMVQQYTGIPSLSPETSLDLFGTRSNQLIRPYTYYPSPSLINDSCINLNLLNTMQNPITFPYNNNNINNNTSLNFSPLLNLKYSTQNPNSSNGFVGIGQTHIHQHHTTLPDLLSTAVTPTATSSRNDDPVASRGNWESSAAMKGDQGFIEPWT